MRGLWRGPGDPWLRVELEVDMEVKEGRSCRPLDLDLSPDPGPGPGPDADPAADEPREVEYL